MKLIVGLGNPGTSYDGTRHNVGFEVLDRLAVKWGWSASTKDFNRLARSRFEGLVMDGMVPKADGTSEKVLLLKPLTYMNRSGRSVKEATSFHQLGPEDLMVVLDDVALPPGAVRMRSGGSSGGHNGLRDIQAALGTEAYPRLRLGVGAPPPRVPQADWVLGRFATEERGIMEDAVARACDALQAWLETGIDQAMSRFNTSPRRDEI
jgi:PTH1 family peptidyl-tRNA hydrolase